MGSNSKTAVVKVGPLEYEAEVLTSITEGSFIGVAVDILLDFADANYHRIKDPEAASARYSPVTPKEKKEFVLFDTLFSKMTAILASDRHGVFESAQQLFELARSDKDKFEKYYQMAIKANPTLDPAPLEAPKEGQENPLG